MADFELLQTGSRIPRDAVVVTIRRGVGRTVADVAATEEIADFPMPVSKALSEAEAMRDKLGLKRIAIMLEDTTLWRNEWGNLHNGASLAG